MFCVPISKVLPKACQIASEFFSKFKIEKKIVAGGINQVQKISKFGQFDMPLGSTFEIGTQIILLKIDGFLKGWILNITPLKGVQKIRT